MKSEGIPAADMEAIPFEPTSRDHAVSYFSKGWSFPPDVRVRFVELIDETIKKLTEGNGTEDLWICRSRHFGPLAGHEGLGIVQNGKIVRYEPIIHH